MNSAALLSAIAASFLAFSAAAARDDLTTVKGFERAFRRAHATVFGQLHENIGPGDNENKTITTKAPSGQYSLIQTQANPPLKSCEEGRVACYQTTIHFQDQSKPDRVVPEV